MAKQHYQASSAACVQTMLKERLVKVAEEQHSRHPQYRGSWSGDNWVVAQAKQDIIHPRRSGIKVLSKGEFVLLDKNSLHTLTADKTARPSNVGKQFVTVYLAKNCGGVNTSLRADSFQIMTILS